MGFLLNQLLHYSPVCLPTCHAAHEESFHENGGGTSNILQVSHSDLRLHSFVQVHLQHYDINYAHLLYVFGMQCIDNTVVLFE